MSTYCVYARSIWHEADAGGYWGDGIAARDQNGGVRGMCGIMLGYAMLVHAGDRGWLDEEVQRGLGEAGLDRATLIKYIRENLVHIAAHHVSNPKALSPKWGLSWQSSLWLGAAGPAALLVWRDLPEDLRSDLIRVAAAEADRVASRPPKDYLPGDTGAEENGWDTNGPAVALAMAPEHPHAPQWWRALRCYAVNTYSVRADRGSDSMVGTDRVRDLVTTANLFDDFTLENHRIFHPEYVQVSGQLIGEAWVILKLGDLLHGSDYAPRFEPYAMHHVRDVWENVARPLLLPEGQLTYPNSTDWVFNSSEQASYLAYIATALHDPAAIVAEQRHMLHARRHSALGPPGRILGDTNVPWFRDPIVIKRSATAMLQHELRDGWAEEPADVAALDMMTETRYWPDAKVWMHRNSEYFVSAAWGQRHMGTFSPNSRNDLDHPYMTLPVDGILPKQVESFEGESSVGSSHVLCLKLADGRRCMVICMPHSVLWISPVPMRAMAIENDKISGGGRTIHSRDGSWTVEAMAGGNKVVIPGWVNIDDRLGLISAGEGFNYKPAKGFNRPSVATDDVVPEAPWGAWQMIPHVTVSQTQEMARRFSATLQGDKALVTVQDGPGGEIFHIEADLGRAAGDWRSGMKMYSVRE